MLSTGGETVNRVRMHIRAFGSTASVRTGATRPLFDDDDSVVSPAPRLPVGSNTCKGLVTETHHSPVDQTLVRAIGGLDVIVNAAGLQNPRSSDWPPLLGTTANLPFAIALASAHAGVQHIVHVRTTAVSGASFFRVSGTMATYASYTSVASVQNLRHGGRLPGSHRSNIFHRLLALVSSHTQTALVAVGFAAASAGFAAATVGAPLMVTVLLLTATSALGSIYLALPFLIHTRSHPMKGPST